MGGWLLPIQYCFPLPPPTFVARRLCDTAAENVAAARTAAATTAAAAAVAAIPADASVAAAAAAVSAAAAADSTDLADVDSLAMHVFAFYVICCSALLVPVQLLIMTMIRIAKALA